ncbi:MAG: SAVED domain-containing protein [Chloroflexota bacterium]|nr:SAVED domain-containing protein [Chloroflexota bacterium]
MSRPIRHFLSHQNGDRAAVVRLETEMRRRGLSSWRDRKDLHRGVATDPVVVKGIGTDTDGFAIYGTRKVLDSAYVWEHEWPPAYFRHLAEKGADHPFPYPLIPIFVDIGVTDLKGAAKAFKQPLPTTFNGERLKPGTLGRRAMANHLLRTALARRAAEAAPGPLRLHLTTFAVADDLDADLLADWSPEFGAGVTTPWADLLHARDDLAAELTRTGRGLEITVRSRLGPAFAFGHAFPHVTRIPITAGNGWQLGRAEDPTLITVTDLPIAVGDPQVAIVEVSLARNVTVAVDRAVSALGLAPSRRLLIGYGPDADQVDAAVAAAATAAFGRRLKQVRDDGVTEAHVFLAGPAPLALLLGASVNAGPAMTLYHTADGEYVRSVRLPA